MNQTAEQTTGPDQETGAERSDWSGINAPTEQDYLRIREWWTTESVNARDQVASGPDQTSEESAAETKANEPDEQRPHRERKRWFRRRPKKQRTKDADNAEDTNDADDAPLPGDTISRLAALGGKRLARRILTRRAELELSDEERAERAKEAEARAERRRARFEGSAPGIVYVLAVGSAVGGQVTGISSDMHLEWAALLNPFAVTAFVYAVAVLAAACAAALLIEGAGFAFAIFYKRARLDGRRGVLFRLAMWAAAYIAAGYNGWKHWGSAWVYPTALGSIAALAVFEAETSLKCAKQFKELRERLLRESAEKALIRRAVRKSRGWWVARQVVAALPPEARRELVAKSVDPEAVTAAALTEYMRAAASSGRPDRSGDTRSGLLRRAWSAVRRSDQTDQKADAADARRRKRTTRRADQQTDQTTPAGPVTGPVDQTTETPDQTERATPQPAGQTGPDREDHDQPAPVRPEADRRPVRAVKQADLDAAELAARYPNGLPLNHKGEPARNQIMRDMSWKSASKATAAIAAYADRQSA